MHGSEKVIAQYETRSNRIIACRKTGIDRNGIDQTFPSYLRDAFGSRRRNGCTKRTDANRSRTRAG
jgi:hypothetical protein